MQTNSITEALQYITDDQSSSFDAAPAFAEVDTLLNSHAALVGALEGIIADLETADEKRTMADYDFGVYHALNQARAALALALWEGGQK